MTDTSMAVARVMGSKVGEIVDELVALAVLAGSNGESALQGRALMAKRVLAGDIVIKAFEPVGGPAQQLSLADPCTHPVRRGRHETYVMRGGVHVCRACGAKDLPKQLP